MLEVMVQEKIDGSTPAMILGERDRALAQTGSMFEHRRVIFALQKQFCTDLQYKDIIDPTTGLRIYTRALAELFVKIGKSKGFGSDVEQLVISSLHKARVIPYKLRRARKRSEATDLIKFKDCKEALLLYKDELTHAGLGNLVERFGTIDFSDRIAVKIGRSRFVFDSDGQALKGRLS